MKSPAPLILSVVVLIALTAWGAAAMAAQNACADSPAAMLKALRGTYGEVPQSAGVLASNGAPISLLANPKTGTWTLTVTTPDGMSCMIANGLNFKAIPQGEPT